MEKQYGWSKCKGKYIWLAPEITGNFAENCDQAQFQQVVEGGRLASAKKYAVETIEFDVLDILNTLRLEPYLTNEDQRIIIKRMLKCSSLYGNVSCSDGGTV